MLEMSDAALAIVQGSFTMAVRGEVWRDGELLAADIPIDDGSEERDRSLAVAERISLSVPRRDRGFDWEPIHPDHPLAAYGQQLRISYGVDVGGSFEWIDRGWFQITESSTDGDTVSVQAEGLLAMIDEAKFAAPFQPSGTFVSTARALVEPALTVEVDDTLIDRSIPVGMQWDDDRMGALTELLDAWPADARVTEDGALRIEPVTDSGTSVLSLTDGTGGTVVRWQGASSRDGAFNCVVARGEDAEGTQIQGVAYDLDSISPTRFDGPFSPLAVPYFHASPLLTTVAQCRTAAQTTLTRLRRTTGRRLEVSMVPHPGLIPGDIVTVTGAGLTAAPCVIESLSLPYSPGEQRLAVRTLTA
ncbi:DUF5047 domain-containing protein [Streptomyces cinnabarinus]|uniref:DUF5047 domain-containing protein n=1 Tax=Streptomyces cinnabarinus TaxID=67287 RepID=A0ABY7K6N5_9ACTN|nr:DUF5047 domain-containing protein [Streptomyces cinnabarinus]WAZ20160.1 DUF5047 domain-containing protein [Streptomyces cinnabarinus]